MTELAITMTKAFYAYPVEPRYLEDSIKIASENIVALEIKRWPKMNILGFKLDNLIREEINQADLLIADITYPNFNVYYEIGYCAGLLKPVIPTVNSTISASTYNVGLTGIFDTIGYLRYQNSDDLAEELSKAEPERWAHHYVREKNHNQPLCILDTFTKPEFRQYIFNSVSHSGVNSYVIDPVETPRLSIGSAIADISAATGVILPLLGLDVEDNLRHNLKAAFLAGLAHGMGLDPLIIQYDNVPAPADFRDFIATTRSRREVDQDVTEYCQQTLVRNQSVRSELRIGNRTLLERIDLGASAAEKESQKLGAYFVRTAEYARALRAAGALVVGRKGSGKSAIFVTVAAQTAEDKRVLLVELSPASHNLSELRENLLSVISVGVFDHTIAAFWQYLVYTEILLALREQVLPKAKYNLPKLKEIEEIEARCGLTDEMVSGDFTGRLEAAVAAVVAQLQTSKNGDDVRSKITNFMFSTKIGTLRNSVAQLASEFDDVLILFDNIDKGWPAKQVEPYDVRMIRHLADTLEEIQRDLRKRNLALNYLLFLRSDVYEELVEETSDRGKYNAIRVDWSDPAQLRYLLRERVISNFSEAQYDEVWASFNPVMDDGMEGADALIRASLMRPRFLIDLAEKAISFAVNRGNSVVEKADVEAALEKHSIYLVTDFGYEIRDVAGVHEKIFYQFIGESSILSDNEVRNIINRKPRDLDTDKIVAMLMWYGFLGIVGKDGKPVFIYDRNYDIGRLEAERDRLIPEVLYAVNSAFTRGLQS